MRNYINAFLISIIILLSGCGAFRNVFKSKEYTKLETKSEIRKDSIGLIVDKSVTTIKEKLDTVITVPGQTFHQDTYLNLDSLVNGMTAVKNDLLDVRLVLNPVTGILSTIATIKPRLAPVKFNKETVNQNDITQQSAMSESKKEEANKSSGSYDIQKEPVSLWWYAAGLIILIIIVISFKSWWKNRFKA
ncbi:hypothetical protein [Pedobacter gandavensis]|uniref:DUF4349 domain-containing protein n=1 Tax=Pedobacter gandavensis TaxID=2679963 RepID=A0ABR6EUA7_9SPHI|nr:hypothetical protein [Pedobacter gandavensis]MBB2148777.1 hypothetical protein [Pedobacter gandavensis]